MACQIQNPHPLWKALSPRPAPLLGLQILSLVAAAGEVANIGALLLLRLLANPTEGQSPWAASYAAADAAGATSAAHPGAGVCAGGGAEPCCVVTIRAQLRLAALFQLI